MANIKSNLGYGDSLVCIDEISFPSSMQSHMHTIYIYVYIYCKNDIVNITAKLVVKFTTFQY